MDMNNITKITGLVKTPDTVLFSPDKNGFLRQVDPKPFDYTLDYKARQSTNAAMSWLRLGWLAAHLPYEMLKGMTVVDIGSGNGVFVKEAQSVFGRIVPYDLAGESITDQELYSTNWDLIVMSDVIEHYPDIDDLWTLAFDRALISFPERPFGTDLRTWRHYKPDEHIYLLDANSFGCWVQVHGYEVEAAGCHEDLIRKRWDEHRVNISTFLIRRK